MLIQEKPLDQITWADLEHLVTTETVEGPTLEFKSGRLLEPRPDETQPKGKRILRHRVSREIAEAVTAFSNASGGLVVLGVREDGDPACAKELDPVANWSVVVRWLEALVKNQIEPLPYVTTFRAIVDPTDEARAIIAIKAPRSLAQPHGVTEKEKPPVAYVRDGARNSILGMRDMQSLFWDARTRRERVTDIRTEHEARLDTLKREFYDQPQGVVTTWGKVSTPGVFIRFTAIAEEALNLAPLAINDVLNLRPFLGDLSALGEGSMGSLRFGAHCLRQDEHLGGHWHIGDDGTVSAMGRQPPGSKDSPDMFVPGDAVATALGVLILAVRLHRLAEKGFCPLQFDGSIHFCGRVGVGRGDKVFATAQSIPDAKLHPVSIARVSDVEPAFRQIERTIWNAYGVEARHRDWNVGRLLGADRN